MTKGPSDRTFRVLNGAALAAVCLVTLYPLLYVLAVSFATPEEFRTKGIVLFPETWTLESYRYLLSTGAFVRSVGVSAYLAVVGTVLSLLVTGALAYALSKRKLKGRKTFLLLILITILFNPGIIPPYLLVRELGLINSLWSIILSSLSSGWYVFLMKSFYDNIPENVEEAATIDGCGDIAVWRKIILPLSLPAMAAFGLFYAVSYWNSFFLAVLYVNDYHKWPLQVLLQNMLIDSSTAGGEMAAEMNRERSIPVQTLKMAAVVISTIPILLVYPFLQKHFDKGVMLGSVKE
ncbi:carbohydrate ABC transporter permease [Paenibacillus cymbidii]|uniref:carbohydrate ABC transporter permease n=1 Tax=Paenibacillus cymbidii TaxID=1639034 RepID=UPI001081302F|nr:carbohydrate ABC transporter permease [Paenibacillus cymbidii]